MTLATRAPWLAAAALAAAALTGCPDETKPRLYKSYETPPSGLFTDTAPAVWDQTNPGDKLEVTQDLIGQMKLLGPQLVYEKDKTDPAKLSLRGVNFSVFSQRAEKVRLLLFNDPNSNKATQQFEMTRLSGSDVWNVFVEGVGLGQYYGYVAWGPNWRFDENWYPGSVFGFQNDVDAEGNRFNPNKLLFDPYCKIFNRGHDWSKGSAGTGPDRVSLTYGAGMKCRVVQSTYTWGDEEKAWREGRDADSVDGHHWNEMVVYEVHPKGFTANASSGVKHSGTFRGFGEKAAYLKDLGITAVEMLPPFEKALDAGYWGYNTLGFFAPEHSYLSRNEMAEGIDEFKWMVEELHKQGIEVILDVVYNHSGEGGLWRQKIYSGPIPTNPTNLDPIETASLLGFRGLDNALYYALPPGNGREYCDYTGVGNTMRCNSPPMQRLIIDSLRYWVEEMHVDGYRFDLAPALGGKDGHYLTCPTSADRGSRKDCGQNSDCDQNEICTWDGGRNRNTCGKGGIDWDAASTMVQTIIDDPVLQKHNTRIIAEPWGAGGYPVGGFAATKNADKPGYGWGEWNNKFRDWWRSFVNQGWALNSKQDGADGGYVIAGSEGLFKWNGRKPYHSINFVTCHDGMTMYDLVSYSGKVNGCGPLNPRCCSDPYSSFCQEAVNSGTGDNRCRDWKGGSCNGVECGQLACYSGACVEAEPVKLQMMRNWFLAMAFSHGTPMIFGGDEWARTQLGNNNTYTPEADNSYSWHDWGQWEAQDDRWRLNDFVKQALRFRREHAYAFAPKDYGTFQDAYWRNEDGTPKKDAAWGSRTLMIHFSDKSKGPELAILINMDETDKNFTLPTGRSWKRLIDTQYFYDSASYLNEKKVSLRKSANATLDAPEAVPGPGYGVKSRTIVVLEAR
ncbi:MAG TPA: alpha-amylase family glycosyl hydrolase [Myxococcales bacterium]